MSSIRDAGCVTRGAEWQARDGDGRPSIGLFATGHIMPIYKDVGIDTDGDGIRNDLDEDDDNDGVLDSIDICPLNSNPTCTSPIIDVVKVNGKTWAQVNLFVGLFWGDINTVCPEGHCISNGVLNGYDMTGWEWASKRRHEGSV